MSERLSMQSKINAVQNNTASLTASDEAKIGGAAAPGHYAVKDGRLCFVTGKNIVFIREHFADNGLTPEFLVENMIRYESKHSLPEKNY